MRLASYGLTTEMKPVAETKVGNRNADKFLLAPRNQKLQSSRESTRTIYGTLAAYLFSHTPHTSPTVWKCKKATSATQKKIN